MAVVVNKKNLPFLKLELQDNMNVFKNVLLALVCVKTALMVNLHFAYGIKFIIMAIVAYFVSREFEYLYYYHFKKMSRVESKQLVKDTNPEITGLIIVLFLPIGVSIVALLFGVWFAIFIVKLAFGGYTFNIFNPALSGVVFIRAGYPAFMNNNLHSGLLDSLLLYIFKMKDSVSGATVSVVSDFDIMHSLKNGFLVSDMIFTLAIVVALAYLVYKHAINESIVLYILATVVIISIVTVVKAKTGAEVIGYYDKYSHFDIFIKTFFNFICNVSLLGIVLCATDPVTSPNTKNAIIINSMLVGIVYMYMIAFVGNTYAIAYAILFGNMMTPFFNKKFTDDMKKSTVAIIVCVSMLVYSVMYYINLPLV